MSPKRSALAIALGFSLSTLPFWPYFPFGGQGEPHSDHAAHYGGQLAMVGDHHIEVRRRGGKVDFFVSDAWRRAIHPSAAWAIFDGSVTVPMHWEAHHLVGDDKPAAHEIEAVVILSDGTRLAISFDFSITERSGSGVDANRAHHPFARRDRLAPCHRVVDDLPFLSITLPYRRGL